MSNQNEVNDTIEEVIPLVDVKPTVGEDGVTDTTDWKTIADQNRKIAEQNIGIAQRNKTRAERFKAAAPAPKPDTTTPAPKPTEGKTEGLGYAEKSFLIVNGIKDADEMALVEKSMKQSGLSLDDILANGFFKSELQTIRDTKAATTATPTGVKRAAPPASDSVDYWLDKYNTGTKFEDIPADLQSKVLDAKVKAAKSSGSNFSSNPIIA